jgi:hypothetical protein
MIFVTHSFNPCSMENPAELADFYYLEVDFYFGSLGAYALIALVKRRNDNVSH